MSGRIQELPQDILTAENLEHRCTAVWGGYHCDLARGHAGRHFSLLDHTNWDDTTGHREEILKREGHKDDSDKVQWHLLDWKVMEEVSRVMMFGEQKYAAWNWALGMKWTRIWSACLRHCFAWIRGEELDEETGISHLAHAICCLMMLRGLQQRDKGEDTRERY